MPLVFEDSLNFSLLSDTGHILLSVPNFEYFSHYLKSLMQSLPLPMKFLEVRDYVYLYS